MSSGVQSPALVTIGRDETDDKIRTLTLNRPPVNSLSLEFLQELIASIDQLEAKRVDGRPVKCQGTDLAIGLISANRH